MEKDTDTTMCTTLTCAQNTVKITSIITRVTIMVFAALTALCGAIAISKVEFRYIELEAKYIHRNPGDWEGAINFNTLICCVILLLANGGSLITEIILLIVSVVKKSSKVIVIVDTVLNSISATVLFGLAVSLATIIDAHAALTYLNNYDRNDYDYDRLYPITVPAKAAAAFGFLTAFAVIGLIVLVWIKFCLDKRQNAAA